MKKSLNFARYCPYKSKYTHIKKVTTRNVHGKSLENILIKKLIKWLHKFGAIFKLKQFFFGLFIHMCEMQIAKFDSQSFSQDAIWYILNPESICIQKLRHCIHFNWRQFIPFPWFAWSVSLSLEQNLLTTQNNFGYLPKSLDLEINFHYQLSCNDNL